MLGTGLDVGCVVRIFVYGRLDGCLLLVIRDEEEGTRVLFRHSHFKEVRHTGQYLLDVSVHTCVDVRDNFNALYKT